MPLTEERKKELLEILDRTSSKIKNASLMKYPKECEKFLDLSEEKVITRTVDGYPYTLYIYQSRNRSAGCPVHINIHGGGFAIGHAPNDSMYSSYLADQIRGIVVDLDYTTSKVAPYPAAFDQCYDAARYTFEQCEAWGGDKRKISIGGFSAGGVLAAGIVLKAADTNDFKFCLQVLGYPPLDNIINPIYKKDGLNRILPVEREEAFTELYFAGNKKAMASPYASPIYASDEQLRKAPRTLVISAGGCNFRFEDEEYAERLASLGVEVTVKRFVGALHGFIPHFGEYWKYGADLIVRSIRNSRI